MKLKCINKVRNANGSIIYYTFAAEDGSVISANRDDIVKEMRTHEFGYEFTNLQIDKAGRLVDKKMDTAEENRINEAIKVYMNKTYENMFIRMSNDRNVHFEYMERIGRDSYSYYVDDETMKYVNMLNKELAGHGYGVVVADVQFLNGFSEFLKTKEETSLLMFIKTRSDEGFTYLRYGMQKVYISTDIDWMCRFASEDNLVITTEVLGKHANQDRNKYKSVKVHSDKFVQNGLAFMALYLNTEGNRSEIETLANKVKAGSMGKEKRKRDVAEKTNSILYKALKLGRINHKLKRWFRWLNMFKR